MLAVDKGVMTFFLLLVALLKSSSTPAVDGEAQGAFYAYA